jgi:hypothetical protein
MRADMASKIVERPRVAHFARNEDVRATRKAARAASPDALDAMPRVAGVKPRRGYLKSFSDFLSPLWRFLRSRVGRPWDEVYGEIRARIAPTSTVQIHVMEHLWHFVVRHVEVRDGRVYEVGGWRGELFRTGWQLYVDPATGLLSEPALRRPARRAPPSPDRLDRGAGLLYLRLDGQWYAVETRPIPPGPPPWDVVRRAPADGVAGEALYGRRGRYAVSKRQLGRKRLRDAGLR